MNKNKGKIIKSGAFLVATALVLTVATVAWFITGNLGAYSDPIAGEIISDSYGYLLLEATDDNMNGILDAGEEDNWEAILGLDINVSNIVPNEYHFYKAIIQTGSRTSLQFKFTGIEVTVAEPEVTQLDFLSLINVRFRTEDDADPAQPMPAGGSIDESMYTLLGDPAAESVVIYTLDLSGYQNRSLTIYYDIGVKPITVPGNEVRGASVSIGAIEFVAN